MSEVGTKTILLLRHGAAGAGSPGSSAARPPRFIGSTDLPLSAAGRKQISLIAPWVHKRRPEVCLCSPMRRCVETAQVVLKHSKLKLELLSDLREVDFGRWENLTFAEIEKLDPGRLEGWAAFDPQFRFPSGECLGDFLARVRRVVKRIANAPQQSVLVVSHGGVIRALICYLLGLHPRRYVLFDVRPATLAVIDVFPGGKGVLAGLIPCSENVSTN